MKAGDLKLSKNFRIGVAEVRTSSYVQTTTIQQHWNQFTLCSLPTKDGLISYSVLI